MREKIVVFTKRVERKKRELQKYILKLIDWKKKKLKNDDDKFIHFFYKNSLNDLNDIKDLNSKYDSKCCQRKKESLLSMKKEKFEINTKEKNVEKIEVYYILIKYSINVQTLLKFDSHSIR